MPTLGNFSVSLTEIVGKTEFPLTLLYSEFYNLPNPNTMVGRVVTRSLLYRPSLADAEGGRTNWQETREYLSDCYTVTGRVSQLVMR